MTTQTDHDLPLERAIEWARTRPDALFMTQPVGDGELKTWTWGQAIDEARRMAAHIQSLDFEPRSQIAIFSKNCAYWIIADLAIWMSGHTSVPIYPTLTADSIRQILDHSESKLVFVGKLDDFASMRPGIPENLPKIAFPLAPETDYDDWNAIVRSCEPARPMPRDRNELATIVYTSGSTGTPKGVMLSFASLAYATGEMASMFKVQAEDRALSYLPLAHVLERFLSEQVSLYSGMQLFFAETLETFVADLKRARPTLFVSVPRLWLKFQQGVFSKIPRRKLERLLRIPIVSYFVRRKVLRNLGLDAVRFAGSGSAPIPGQVLAWYRRLGMELLEGYGMTENFCYSHFTYPGEARAGYIGRPYKGVQCRIADDGEIQVKSPTVMMGYFKAPELTAEIFTDDGYLKTGDRGEVDDIGRLKITGRVKELFKTSKGKYVAPAPIENRLVLHPDLEAACVTGSGYPQPHAVVMLADETRARLKDSGDAKAELETKLQNFLREVNAKLDHHEHLQFISVAKDAWGIENGFLTPTLKIKRSRIEDVYGPAANDWYAAKKRVIWQ